MSNRNSGFDGNPGHDLCTEVAMMEHGHLISSGTYHSGHSNDDEAPELLAEGDKNQDYWDEHYHGNGDGGSSLIAIEDEDDLTQNYLLDQLAEEQAIEAAALREEQLSEMYDRSKSVPFFMYQHNRGTSQHAAQTRSEAYETACSLGGRMRHANPNKHQQFYAGLRIH